MEALDLGYNILKLNNIHTYKIDTAFILWDYKDHDIKVDLDTGFSGLKDNPDHELNDTLTNIENIDFDKIANNFQISGGSILNVLRYCVIQTAKRNNGRVLEKDIIDAIKIEYDKEGQTI